MHTPKLNKTPGGIYYVYANRRKVYLGKDDPRIIKERYRSFLAEYFNQDAHNPQPLRYGITVKKLAENFLSAHSEYYVKRGRQTGQLDRFRTALSFPIALFPNIEVDEFRSLRLKETRDAMINSERFSRKYANTLVNCIRHVFAWGVEQELVKPETLISLKALSTLKRGRTIARETQPVKPVSIDDVNKTIPFLPPVVRAMVMTQRFTGMRPVEVCTMRVGDLREHGDGYLYILSTDKTDYRRELNDKRTVIIGANAAQYVRPYIEGKLGDDFVFPSDSKENRGYLSCSYTRAIARASKRAGVHWSPNQLRHLFATEVREKFGLEAAQVVLGHRTANVTQIYAERNIKLAMEAVEALG